MTSRFDLIASLAGGPAVCFDELPWTEIKTAIDSGNVMAILPIGAIEQHGPHLPVNTDVLFADAFCRYASAKSGLLMLPAIAYGVSLGHTDRWPGTLSLMPETLIATICEIAEFLRRTGFKKLLIVNSHWGNQATIRCAIDKVRFQHAGRFSIGFKNTFDITAKVWQQFTQDAADFHANRAETSLMQFLAPSLIRDVPADDPDRTAGKIFTYVVPQTSLNGVTGFPSQSSPEEGKLLFIEVGDALTQIILAARDEEPPINWNATQGA